MTKTDVHKACLALLNHKVSSLQTEIEAAQQAASEDTKSSAGDKFETGREMIKQRINQLSQQLSQQEVMAHQIERLDPQQTHSQAQAGSLVQTSEGTYYLAAPVGKLSVLDRKVFVLSLASPIGQLLLGKKEGEEIQFRGRRIVIDSLS
ncbi:MAG: 3-oxoacyl-ACP synthase [Bacteroidota bacterium]